jgi:hypothetical protein
MSNEYRMVILCLANSAFRKNPLKPIPGTVEVKADLSPGRRNHAIGRQKLRHRWITVVRHPGSQEPDLKATVRS